MKTHMESVDFFNGDRSLSHWSVCECDEIGTPIDVSTGLMHDTFEQCEAERIELETRSTP